MRIARKLFQESFPDCSISTPQGCNVLDMEQQTTFGEDKEMTTSFDYERPTAQADFPYSITTTAMMEHSSGVAWIADLFRNGRKVGTVENRGDGGGDIVRIDAKADRLMWNIAITEAFGHASIIEEAATFYLMCAEFPA